MLSLLRAVAVLVDLASWHRQHGRAEAALEADLERLRMALDETAVLWQPYRRLLRWLQHPLAIALVQSLMRRRAAAR
jgi:hypothetical protein